MLLLLLLGYTFCAAGLVYAEDRMEVLHFTQKARYHFLNLIIIFVHLILYSEKAIPQILYYVILAKQLVNQHYNKYNFSVIEGYCWIIYYQWEIQYRVLAVHWTVFEVIISTFPQLHEIKKNFLPGKTLFDLHVTWHPSSCGEI